MKHQVPTFDDEDMRVNGKPQTTKEKGYYPKELRDHQFDNSDVPWVQSTILAKPYEYGSRHTYISRKISPEMKISKRTRSKILQTEMSNVSEKTLFLETFLEPFQRYWRYFRDI